METRNSDIDANLIKQALRNNRNAQFELYKKYNKSMYNTALRITSNTALAEDVIQESFLSAFQSLEFYRGQASFGTWLKRIVVNKAITMTRKELYFELKADISELDSVEVEEDHIHYTLADVKRAIEELPNGFRTVLSLYLIEGYDHQEISEILDISESTSKTQYKRAKEKLRSIIKKIYDERT